MTSKRLLARAATFAAFAACVLAPATLASPTPVARTAAGHHGSRSAARRRARCRRGSSHWGSRAHRGGRRRARCRRSSHRRAHHRRQPAGRSASPHSVSGVPASVPAALRGASCTGTELTPTEANLDQIRDATMCLINRERESAGEPPLAIDSKIQQAAQAHTEDMAVNDYFDHTSPGGDTLLMRLQACGYLGNPEDGYDVGENIAEATVWQATPQAIVADWMASPEHRANILNAKYHDSGIGVLAHPPASLADGLPGAVYTEDFGVIITG